MPVGLVTLSYIGAISLFILALKGLGHQQTARNGNRYGMAGMTLAVLATVLGPGVTDNLAIILIAMLLGASIGLILAKQIKMTQMPELVAILHSLVGLAAVLASYSNFLDPQMSFSDASQKNIHHLEIYLGILIGSITFSGSLAAFAKLSGKLSGQPMLLPLRHWLNLSLIITMIYLGSVFMQSTDISTGLTALYFMTVIALFLGLHMVLAIGGADMPVVVSMLNSYSGWAASATGFMLANDLLIVTGALVGSSGAILSYIMCRAMNRSFISVIAGGFGNDSASSQHSATTPNQSDVATIETKELSELLLNAKEVMIIPGYGMAVAQAQHILNEISHLLRDNDINVRFAIHPVAGRMPGHMNVLLAEAKIPYDIVHEMEEINEHFPNIDVSIVIGANDIVNPASQEDPDSTIAGMPVLECWKSRATIVLKRSMASGYAGIDNPLFFKDNTYMYFGDAKDKLSQLHDAIANTSN